MDYPSATEIVVRRYPFGQSMANSADHYLIEMEFGSVIQKPVIYIAIMVI